MTRSLSDWFRVEHTAFCPGCGHGILLGAIIRAVDDLALDRRRLLFVSGIGCAAWIPSPNIKADTLHTLHGRAVAYATGAKLAKPELNVLVVSGDGDLSSIGGNHLIHGARRNIDMTVICANNQIYGMTGGQTASTTPLGSHTATEPSGSKYRPFDLCALVRAAGAPYAARWPVTRTRSLIDSIKKAVRIKGFTFVEVMSPCPTQFGRRNRFDDVTALYDHINELCIDRDQAGDLSPGQLAARIVIGEFGDE
ncbi:MAG TPA: thiamine pyrophosphate-dependent enzyme [Myxococcota bacterium]|nr:thiamine pyrophosphate-dependent enzyme [Myxococcota bacterium]